jgi:hypothetical protein
MEVEVDVVKAPLSKYMTTHATTVEYLLAGRRTDRHDEAIFCPL